MHMSGDNPVGRVDPETGEVQPDGDPGMLFLTLTVRHDRNLPLEFSLDVLLDAYRRMQAGKWWRQAIEDYGIVGSIKSVEVTYSVGDGWHPHLHLLFFTRYKLTDGQYEHFCRLLREPVQADGGGRPTQPWAGWVERAAKAVRKRHLKNRYEVRCCPAVVSEVRESADDDPKPGDWIVTVRDLVADETMALTLRLMNDAGDLVDETCDRWVCESEGQARGIAEWLRPTVDEWNEVWHGDWANFDVKRLCPDAEHGFDLEQCSREWSNDLARYICKLQDEHDTEWTVGAELTRGDVKDAGRHSDGDVHITPFQLLDDDCPLGLSVKRRQMLWAEFVAATRGRRAVGWTPGLKQHFRIESLTDNQVLTQARQHIVGVWQLDEVEYERIRREQPARLAQGLIALGRLDVKALAELLPGRWVKRPDDELVQAIAYKDVIDPDEILERADDAFWRQLRESFGLVDKPEDWRQLIQGYLDLDLGDPAGSSRGGSCAAAA